MVSVAHTPSKQPPKHDDKEHEWQEVEDDVPDVGIFLVVVAVASELVLLLLDVEEMLQLVDRTKLYGDGRVAANLLGRHVKHLAYVFGFDIHLQRCFPSC